MSGLAEVDLDDRYAADDGPALITGIQALVRLFIHQRRLDERRGLRTSAFVSGYPGSPLGGLDRELARARAHLEPERVVFEAGVNEELAATAVAGTQLVPQLPGREVDGVTGYWFGKAPGLDRAADAIRHANTSGTTHLGGAVALIGDDPMCKSSTLPSSCELMAESLVLPLLVPGDVSDIVRLGMHAVAISREAGLWTAIKIVSDVADSAAGLLLDDPSLEIPEPPAESRGPAPTLLGASSVAAEHDLMSVRIDRARAYGREHRLNRVVFEPSRPRTCVVAPAPAFAVVRRALRDAALTDADLDALGIRLVRLDLVWPLDPADVARFAADVERVVVIEDKRPFVETQIRDLLYGADRRPAVLGKRDAQGRPLVPLDGAVSVQAVTEVVDRLWGGALPDHARARYELAVDRRERAPRPLPVARTPFFCSGCPHNLSTKADPDQLVGAGIGCHSLVAVDPVAGRGHLLGAPQMGGEGAQWIGMAPFTSDDHYVQNIGDGTFHHSGSLAIRAAVAANVNLTFRLLYNDAIAMTGGQTAPGRLAVPELTRELELEGVRRIIVTSEDPDSFSGVALASIAEVRSRDELERAQAELAATAGVTVLLHTDRCATEERRLRKRGTLEAPAQRVWINERVCEGCGDCGRQSTCLSVTPTETEFGRKTQIHQSSCTQDFACLEGDCPSFVLVTPAGDRPPRRRLEPPVSPREPQLRIDPARPTLIRMPGIGGTGVVTISQIVQMAAVLEGKWASALDQTGLAQKGGAVVSDVRIAPEPDLGGLRAGDGEVDVLLGLDPLGTLSPQTVDTLDPDRTIAIVNLHQTPTAGSVIDVDAPQVSVDDIVARLATATRGDQLLGIDAERMAQRLFADHMPANMIMLGAAFQHGCLPVGADAIARAIDLNGTGAETNRAAFAWGRAAAVDRSACERALEAIAAPPAVAQSRASRAARRLADEPGFAGELAAIVSRRAGDLADYQDLDYARGYVAAVERVWRRESEALGGASSAIASAYATGLHKLMAYKDEYEVARLHLDVAERARREQAFGAAATVEVMLHPPLLRSLGLRRKLKLRRSARPLFRTLVACRRLRGTPLDPFGRTEMRRTERALVAEYRDAVERLTADLSEETSERAVRVAGLVDMIRGYEEIKAASVAAYRAAVAGELAAV